ncbi:hypothetical protein [Pedobacter sp. JCM 36344]|uniref:hypothetical protein n=1 Tax=Pedobacter sp. JCM 36344 TaxID=3374280 RepID=UPI00397E73E9
MRATTALRYAKENKMNTLLHTGRDKSPFWQKPFIVYDFKSNKIIIKGLCAHGSDERSTPFKIFYGNKIHNNCTSLGKYK